MFQSIVEFFSPTITTTKPEDNMADIVELPNGRFGLVDRKGILITDYARKRDAVRGASRRGLEVA